MVRHLSLWSVVLAALAAPLAAQAQPACEFPGVLLVLDRSISMYTGRIGDVRKWDIARDATAGILNDHEDAAHFGLMIYPGPSGSGANGVVGQVGACDYNGQNAGCAPLTPRCTTGEVVVDIAPNTTDAINGALAWPNGIAHSYTPTWQSLEAASNYRPLRQAGRRNFVILITDGYQCCGLNVAPDGSQSCTPEDQNLIPDRVGRLTDMGITTYVVGFGDQTDARTLHRAAIRAGTTRPGCDPNAANPNANQVCYYQASQADQLRAFLDAIVRQIADEVCDGQDNDCDGRADEQLARGCEGLCGEGQEICFNGAWGDCSAPNAQAEACNGRDDDCDGRTDEAITRDCATACGVGRETCQNGRFQGCNAPVPGDEACNGRDDDCDGVTDEGCDCQPGDSRACGDNRGRCRPGNQRCLPDGTWGGCEGGVQPDPETCNGVDDDCDGIVDGMLRGCQTACGPGEETCIDGEWQGCDAPDLIAEDCNQLDDDCDGRIDENVQRTCDTACGQGIQQCRAGMWTDCSARGPEAEDCGNGRDDDCNGLIDDGCDCVDGQTQPCGTDVGICSTGTQTCAGSQWGDCVGDESPRAEVCNGYDDDCDGRLDEGDLCDGADVCACGACSPPCENGECPGFAMCFFGACVEDHCPDGTVCEDGTCVPGENGAGGGGGDGRPDGGTIRGDGGMVAGSSPSDDCNCDLGRRDGNPWSLLLLGLIFLRRRRAAR
ncbi:MAG: VWA domain-containing protein [Myxococcales bacterium]|nr:VWA domain-containing protein [Myxococcales bacterium]